MRTPSTLGFAAALASAVVSHAGTARTSDSPPPLAPESGHTPGAPDEIEPWTRGARRHHHRAGGDAGDLGPARL